MCGIAGIVGPDAARHQQAVARMLDSMEHRGPDGIGIWASPSGLCVLGHRRLAILDLSEAAEQPMHTKDGRCHLTYNGEIYNFQEIRGELERGGDRFESTGDTEVLLRLIAKSGTAALPRLNGMFAFGFWNEEKRTLLLARDRFGQKPLYYTRVKGLIVFASEIRALLASNLVERRLDIHGVYGFLFYGAVQEPNTVVSGVSMVPRGSSLTLRAGEMPVAQRFWAPPRDKRIADDGELKNAFADAVNRHLVSDVPIGVFLSGGIDSSAVAAAASRSSNSEVTSLAVIFPDQPAASEQLHARRVAEANKTRHVEIPITGHQMLDMLPRALAALDQPSIDGVNTYIVSAAAREAGLTVALSGLGGDELFGGYSSFRDTPRLQLLRKSLSPASFFLKRLRWLDKLQPPLRPAKIVDLFDTPAGLVSAYLIRRRLFSFRQVRKLCPQLGNREWLSGLDERRIQEIEKLIEGRKSADAIGHLELLLYMGQTLLRDSDVMGMAHSLEIRQPFLDNAFTDMALRLDDDARKPRSIPKHRFVRAMGDWLPAENVQRPKTGFTLPFQSWLTGPLRDQVSETLQSISRQKDLLDAQSVQAVWSRFLNRPTSNGWSRPWALFVLANYLENQKLSP
ncbi:MAG: asparagine synthase (glutamine-hydrolyzing) [Deltaproteobacteria bacterium]|nr:asparagine synthase (glutamine-hydrolyzing) [Deltaproteobacteria bacterium]